MVSQAERFHLPQQKDITPAQNLIEDISSSLGSSFCTKIDSKIISSNQNGLLIYKEILFKKRGLLGLDHEFFGAQNLLTLIVDSKHIREMEKQKEEQEILTTPVRRIDGWMPEDGRNLVLQSIGPEDIPSHIREKLSGIPYFATSERFTYIFQGISVGQFLADKLSQVGA